MRTAIFSACYLEGRDSMGNNRLERNLEYLKWYRPLLPLLGAEIIVLADNCSGREKLMALNPSVIMHEKVKNEVGGNRIEVVVHGTKLLIYEYEHHLGRVETGHHGYIYCWRALHSLIEVFALGYDKVIVLDTDGYVVSGRFARWLRDLKSGWTSVWCPRHSFPESSIFVLCRDTLPLYQKFCEKPYQERVGELMEQVLPFTHVERGFICDRYGETNQPQPEQCDYYGQRRLSTPMTFRENL